MGYDKANWYQFGPVLAYTEDKRILNQFAYFEHYWICVLNYLRPKDRWAGSKWKVDRIEFRYTSNPETTFIRFDGIYQTNKQKYYIPVIAPRTVYQIYQFLCNAEDILNKHQTKIFFYDQLLICKFEVVREAYLPANIREGIGKNLYRKVKKLRQLDGLYPFSQESDNGETDFECKE